MDPLFFHQSSMHPQADCFEDFAVEQPKTFGSQYFADIVVALTVDCMNHPNRVAAAVRSQIQPIQVVAGQSNSSDPLVCIRFENFLVVEDWSSWVVVTDKCIVAVDDYATNRSRYWHCNTKSNREH